MTALDPALCTKLVAKAREIRSAPSWDEIRDAVLEACNRIAGFSLRSGDSDDIAIRAAMRLSGSPDARDLPRDTLHTMADQLEAALARISSLEADQLEDTRAHISTLKTNQLTDAQKTAIAESVIVCWHNSAPYLRFCPLEASRAVAMSAVGRWLLDTPVFRFGLSLNLRIEHVDGIFQIDEAKSAVVEYLVDGLESLLCTPRPT